MELTQKQKEAIRSKARYKVLNWGRRSGKTTEFAYEALGTALTVPDAKISYYAQTYGDARDIAWDIFLKVFGEAVEKKNESLLEIIVNNLHGGTSKVTLRGWESVVIANKGRGTENDLLLLDEVAFCRGFAKYWDTVLDPTLLTSKGRVVFASTPNGFNDFYDISNRAQANKSGDWFYSHATSYDNPANDFKWLDDKKNEILEDKFSQEYLADFRKQSGLVYKDFDRFMHIKPDFELNYGWRFYRTMDFGAVNPTVCLWIALDNSDTIYVYDEYFNTAQTAQFHANIIQGKTSPEYPISETYGDPSAKQEMLDYANYGVNITPALRVFTGADHDWVNSGIEQVRQALKINAQTGRPRLYVHSKCVNLIREFESYHWAEIANTGQLKDQPEKVDDHCMDALRYFVVSYEKPQISYEMSYQQPANSWTGY